MRHIVAAAVLYSALTCVSASAAPTKWVFFKAPAGSTSWTKFHTAEPPSENAATWAASILYRQCTTAAQNTVKAVGSDTLTITLDCTQANVSPTKPSSSKKINLWD